MNLKGIIWLVLLLSLIISIGFVSAADMNDTTTEIVTQSSEIDLTDINEENTLEITQENHLSSQDDSRVIYVGQNKTIDGGNGTLGNPFNSFELACNNLSGENKVEINVYNGTYYLDSDLKFNTSNLFINGIGEVIIKNLNNENGCYASLGLTSSSANFTFNNLIFDASNSKYLSLSNSNKPHFHVFMGKSNLGIFNNCSFINFSDAWMFSSPFNRKFNYCNFLGSYNHLGFIPLGNIIEMEFNYCTFSSRFDIGNSQIKIPSNITFNNVWFGQNDYLNYVKYTGCDERGYWVHNCMFPVNMYAVFSSWENYLGNDTFEIVGKLTWDDGTTDGIEKLYPLTVKFSSKTGILPQNTTLVNGEFKVIYKSESKDNHIEVTLDSEDIFLDFKNDIQVSAKPIVYGEDQNITITLPQSSQGIAYISVNNNTYEYQVNGSSLFNFTVPDELLAGVYSVYVKLIDNITHLYGQDIVEWNISQIDKELIIQTPADANVDDDSIFITILLEDDETGNITVFAGDKNKTQECLGGSVNIDISDLLVGGNNNIELYYSGNKKYTNQTKSDQITVNRINPKINITTPVNPHIFDEININITLPANATGNITIYINNKNKTITELNTLNIVDITDLLGSGLNTGYIKYSGDNWWDSQTKRLTVNVAKITPSMDVNIIPDTVSREENFTIKINLPQNTTGKILIKNNEKNYQINVTDNNTINLSSNIMGVNKINITYTGDDNYNSISKIVNVTVKYDSLLTASDVITDYNLTNELVATLTDVNGNVLVNKTVNIIVGTINENLTTNDKGLVSVDVSSLVPDSYVASISFAGDELYEGFNTSANVVVNKVVPNINISHGDLVPGEKLNIEVEIQYATENVTIIVNGDKNTTKLIDNVATYTIDELAQGTYYVTVLYSGDDICDFTYKTDSFDVVKSTADLINDLNKIIDNQNSTIEAQKDQINTLNDTVNVKEGIIDSQAEQISVLNETVIAQNSTIESQSKLIDVLNETVIAQNGTIESQKDQIATLNDTVNVKEGIIDSQVEQISVLNETVIAQNSTIESQSKLIDVLNETVIAQNSTIESQKDQIAILNDTVNSQNSTSVIQAQKDRINELNEIINNQNRTIESQKDQIAILNDTVNSQNSTSVIQAQKDRINELNDIINSQNSTIAAQKEKINILNDTIVEQNKTISMTLNPVATSILVGNISTTASTSKYFIISLVDANNVPLVNKTVKFAVNGKTDIVVTNGSGVATVKVSYSTAGTRYYTFSFFGETGYSASIASAKVVVNKKTTKLTAPKKTFKAKTKTKKVQVKLTAGKTVLKNKKVTLKVKGKTYTAKTNKKGIATFKITKLTKKGTFKYNVKFAGDKAYKAVNKNGKITIK